MYLIQIAPVVIGIRVETGSDHLAHVLSRSSRFDLVYKISGSDPDSTLDHMC